MRLILAFIALSALSACQLAGTSKKVAAFSVDAAASYCKAAGNSVTEKLEARRTVRAEVHPELISENMEMCLGCPGDSETFCVGEDRPKAR